MKDLILCVTYTTKPGMGDAFVRDVHVLPHKAFRKLSALHVGPYKDGLQVPHTRKAFLRHQSVPQIFRVVPVREADDAYPGKALFSVDGQQYMPLPGKNGFVELLFIHGKDFAGGQGGFHLMFQAYQVLQILPVRGAEKNVVHASSETTGSAREVSARERE